MPNVLDIFEGQDAKVVRIKILDFIERRLQDIEKPLDNWQKASLGDAIQYIEWNLNSDSRLPKAWRTVCLHAISDARTPNNDLEQIKAPTQEQLIEQIKWLRREIANRRETMP